MIKKDFEEIIQEPGYRIKFDFCCTVDPERSEGHTSTVTILLSRIPNVSR
jgi:hypothetical protein